MSGSTYLCAPALEGTGLCSVSSLPFQPLSWYENSLFFGFFFDIFLNFSCLFLNLEIGTLISKSNELFSEHCGNCGIPSV
jgi:hypothetical protein